MTASDRLGTALADRYRVERELGAGGMATVYLAQDLRHDRQVAIKVLRPELAAVIGAERFLSEIRTTANLQHPHILPLFDSGECEGLLYYEPPFSGPTAQSIVAKVLTEEPAGLVQRRRTVPAAVEAAVLTALQKLPADRWESAKAFADALDGSNAPATRVLRAATVTRSARHTWLMPASVALALLASGVAAWGWRSRPRPTPPLLARYEVRLPYHQRMRTGYSGGTIALSPDGGTIAFLARRTAGRSALMVRDRDVLEPRALEGTEGADAPFFSPDGNWIGYTVGGRMFKVPVSGGAPTLLSDSANVNIPSGHWGADGTITFVGAEYDIRTIADDGGPTRIVFRPPGNVVGYVFPAPLPRGDALLATSCTVNCADMTLVAIEPGPGTVHELAKHVARAWYRSPGRVVFVRQDGGVFVQAFDQRGLALQGTPEPLIGRVGMGLGVSPELALSAAGTLLHVEPGTTQKLRVMRIFRDGRQDPVDPGWTGDLSFLALSPNGRRLAVTVADGARTEVWVKQLDRGPFTRLAYEGSVNYRPAWQPDGRTLGFISDREGRNLPYQVRGDGSGPTTRVPLADTLDIDAGVRRVAITTLPSTAPGPVEMSKFDQYMPVISPDARWLAYVSVESGREEVYIRPVAAPGSARWQVSTAGGTSPVWSHGGRELFFVDAANELVAVPVAAGATFEAGEPRPLVRLEDPALPPFHQGIAVTPDDRAFLFLQDASAADQSKNTATLTLNALAPGR